MVFTRDRKSTYEQRTFCKLKVCCSSAKKKNPVIIYLSFTENLPKGLVNDVKEKNWKITLNYKTIIQTLNINIKNNTYNAI